MDDELQYEAQPFDHHGCTAVTGLIVNDYIYVANAGDSRAVLSVNGYAKPMSFDHKPTNVNEEARINRAGSYVELSRVNGKLALSRAIGDFSFKERWGEIAPHDHAVTAHPDVIERQISKDEDEFLVLACDGIWDCMTSQQVIEFVRRSIAEGQELRFICENIMNHCLDAADMNTGIGTDNMTIMIVGLFNGRSKSEWYKHIKEKVETFNGPAAALDEIEPIPMDDEFDDSDSEKLDLEMLQRHDTQSLILQQLLGNNAMVKNENGIMVIENTLSQLGQGLQASRSVNRGGIESIDDDDIEENSASEHVQSQNA